MIYNRRQMFAQGVAITEVRDGNGAAVSLDGLLRIDTNTGEVVRALRGPDGSWQTDGDGNQVWQRDRLPLPLSVTIQPKEEA